MPHGFLDRLVRYQRDTAAVQRIRMLADTPFVHILHPTRFDAVKLVAVDGFDDGPVLKYPFVIADMRFLFVPVGVNDPVRDESRIVSQS